MAHTLRKLSSAPAPAHATGGPRAPARRVRLLRLVPGATLILFLGPIAAGLVFTLLPGIGWLPALGGHGLSLAPWRALMAAPELPGALRLTLFSGLTATLIAFGLTILFVATCHGTPVFGALRRLLAPLLAIPHAAMALGLAFLIAPSGWIARVLSPWATGWETPPEIGIQPDAYGLGLVLGLALKETPYLLLMTLAALDQIPVARSLAIARSLGYGPAMGWLKVVLPQLYPQIRLPLFAVLAFALSVVDMAIVLGPGTPPTLAVLLTRWFNDPDLEQRFVAAAGATLQLGLVAAAIALWLGAEWSLRRLLRRCLGDGRRGGAGRAAAHLGAALTTGLFALAGASLAGMALWSVATRWRYPDSLPAGLTLETWLRHAGALAWPLSVTLIVALVAAAAALVLVVGCLENEQRHGLHPTSRALWLLYVPLLAPQISFLFGLQVLLAAVGLDGSWAGLVWSHLLFVLPYVFLSLADPWRALDERYARSALCLGASPGRVLWRIKLPMLIRPLLFAGAIGVAVSVAQYLPTLFAGAGRFATLTTEAVTLSSGGDRRVTGAYAFLQALLPLCVFAGAIWWPAARRRGFSLRSRAR